MEKQKDAPSFEIGAPYLIEEEYERLRNWANAIFAFADENRDYCVTREEMTNMMRMFLDFSADPRTYERIARQTF